MAQFFVSYSRSVKDEVQKVVDLLRASGHDVWWDGDIPIIADWWATILDKIEWCELFIFVTSEKSVESLYCIAELKYANDRQRPILPFMLEDPTTLKLPSHLPSRNQWLLYDGDPAHMLEQINTAYHLIEWGKHNDISTRRPPEPNKGGVSLAKQYQDARQLAQDLHFDEARNKFQNIKRLDYREWGSDCDEWLGRISSYEAIIDLANHDATHKRAQRDWTTHVRNYGNEFDPYGVEKLRSNTSSSVSVILIVAGVVIGLIALTGFASQNPDLFGIGSDAQLSPTTEVAQEEATSGMSLDNLQPSNVSVLRSSYYVDLYESPCSSEFDRIELPDLAAYGYTDTVGDNRVWLLVKRTDVTGDRFYWAILGNEDRQVRMMTSNGVRVEHWIVPYIAPSPEAYSCD